MRKLKLLFTNKYYRWATLEGIKLKLISLPGIKHIVSKYYEYKIHKKIQNMSQWEQYMALRNMENDSKEFSLISALIRLQASIMAEG